MRKKSSLETASILDDERTHRKHVLKKQNSHCITKEEKWQVPLAHQMDTCHQNRLRKKKKKKKEAANKKKKKKKKKKGCICIHIKQLQFATCTTQIVRQHRMLCTGTDNRVNDEETAPRSFCLATKLSFISVDM